MALSRRNNNRELNAWPGWVDALSSLVMVVIFLLMLFVVAQFFLVTTLTGRDDQLQSLTQKMAEMNNVLALERDANTGLHRTITQISDQLKSEREANARERALLQEDLKSLRAVRQQLEGEISERVVALRLSEEQRQALLEQIGSARDQSRTLEAKVAEASDKTMLVQKEVAQRDQQIDVLNQQIATLREQLARIGEVLDLSERKAEEQRVQIVELGSRLNQALASKVQELARYRSEFFGRMREALGARQDIRIAGDRFIFQSDILFPSGSAELQEGGKKRMAELARTLLEISKAIPADINWALRVDGHTDIRPIARSFASNWELSSARAIAVVKFLIEQGIPGERLVAAGFGEFQPLEAGATEEALARNRRIEIKFDQR